MFVCKDQHLQLFTTMNRGVAVTWACSNQQGHCHTPVSAWAREQPWLSPSAGGLSPARALCWTVMLIRHCRREKPRPRVTLGTSHGVTGDQPRPGVLLW